jgi:hypothetical protein
MNFFMVIISLASPVYIWWENNRDSRNQIGSERH